jgi:undecaprenyl-diphosphatase
MNPTSNFRFNRHWAVAAFSFLLLGLFVYLLHELLEIEGPNPFAFDDSLLQEVKARRSFGATRFFLEITALGSASVLTTLCLGILVLLGTAGRWLHAAQLVFVSLGGWGLMELLKRTVGRERPNPADQLDFVSGFSFPSGHSSSASGIYLTLAFFLLPLLKTDLRRALFLTYAGAFVSLIAFSRVYLGVHYPTDAFGGICLGTGLACLSHQLFHRPWRNDNIEHLEG